MEQALSAAGLLRSSFALSCLVVSSAQGQKVVPVDIPDSAVCAACSISLVTLVTLGDRTGAGRISAPPDAVRSDHSGRYWVIANRRPPLLFNRTGSFLGTLGGEARQNQFGSPIDAVAVSGDSMLILQPGRAIVVTGDLRLARTITLPDGLYRAAVTDWPTNVLMNGILGSSASAGWPLHRVSFADSLGHIRSSFGPDGDELALGSSIRLLEQVAQAPNGRVWAADLGRYRLSLWAPEGVLLQSFVRRPSWFTGREPMTTGGPTVPPSPMVSAIQQDSAGLLWVFIRRAAPTWRSAWSAVPRTAVEVNPSKIALEKLFRTTVEVIDPVSGQLLTRRDLDLWVTGALPGGRAVVVLPLRDGVRQVSIVSLSLIGR